MSKRQVTSPPRGNQLIDPLQAKRFAFITLAYTLIILLLIPLLGATFAAIMTTPIWGILFLIYSKWEKVNASPVDVSWRALLKFPVFNYWNILWINVTILIVQGFIGVLFGLYTESYRPEFGDSMPDDFVHAYDFITDDFQGILITIIGAYLSFLAGGYIAAKLPNDKCPSPYRHAIFGSLILSMLMCGFMVPVFLMSDLDDPPTIEQIGPIILFNSTFLLFSIAGVWLAKRKRIRRVRKNPLQRVPDDTGVALTATSSTLREQATRSRLTVRNKGKGQKTSNRKRKKQDRETIASPATEPSIEITTPDLLEHAPSKPIRWSRRRFAIISTCVALVLTGFVGWGLYRSKPSGVVCENPPLTATLNYWPVTYAASSKSCNDYQSVDGRLVGDQYEYSQSQEEWERGLTARVGDEIFIAIYVNNGAVDNAEKINPGMGIARNVSLTTEIDLEPSALHYVRVRFVGDNTNTVNNSYKINTPGNERLEVVPKSGEIRDYQTTKVIATDLDIGNNTIPIGDLPPKWEAGRFLRFRLRVVP